MVNLYENLIAGSQSKLLPIVVGIVLVVTTYVLFKQVNRLFSWLRAKKSFPPQVSDVVEPLAKQLIKFAGVFLLLLDVSAILGLFEAVSAIVPSIVIAVTIIALTWLSLQTAKHVFASLRMQGRLSLEVVNAVDMAVKYAILIVGSTFSALNVVASLGYSDLVLSLFLGWFGLHLGRIILIVAALVVTHILSKFVVTFFEDLKKRTTLQPKIVDLASILVRYLIYSIVGLLVFASFITLIGAPELTSLITGIFTVLVGVGLSFAAAGAIGNFIAGLILMNWRPYTSGDRVDIGNGVYGDVVDFDLIFTKVVTPTKEKVFVPNSLIIGNKIINYSPRCIVHPKVTVGYDADRKIVEGLLIKAAFMTDGLLAEPEPCVYIRALADNRVEYELRAYTDQPNRLMETYSSVQKNILDLFDEANIDLMIPQYSLDATYFMMSDKQRKI